MSTALANDEPRCPRCRSKVKQIEHKLYRCDQCKMLTDCEDDGVVGYKPPERNASRKEEYEQRQAARRERQRQYLTRNRRLR